MTLKSPPFLVSAGDPKPFKLLALLVTMALSVVCSSAQAQHGHLNAGAVIPEAGAQLLWANGDLFATNSGYVQPMTLSTNGVYAGYYNSGPTMTALPTSPDNGGPVPFAAAQGSFINAQLTLISAPEGGHFGFWDTGATAPTYSLGVGDSTSLIALSDETLGAGNLGADPYGHIHGRRFSGTKKGAYIVGMQLIATDDHGPGAEPIHTPSEVLYVTFAAVPLQPLLSAPVWLTNRFAMRLSGESNQNYTIQVSTNASSTNWTSLYVTNNPATNTFMVIDPAATGKQRFYRALIGP